MTDLIPKYTHQLKKLRRAPSKLGYAPHKPILLLSVLQSVRNGNITSNRIFITPELVASFKTNWNLLVETHHTSNFSLPFFHLRSEPFWKLSYLSPNAVGIKSISTLNVLKTFVAFAEVDMGLFNLWLDIPTNLFFEEVLLDTYFPNTKTLYKTNENSGSGVADDMKNDMLNDSPEMYQIKMDTLYAKLSEEEYEEDRFIRSGIFKREVPRVYDHTCAISGMKIDFRDTIQMVDACHIIPFSVSKDDTITNGICLSPNLHRAFDRGLITINENYIVRVAPDLKENDTAFSLRQFDGKTILLPSQAKFYPSPLHLLWHKQNRFIL